MMAAPLMPEISPLSPARPAYYRYTPAGFPHDPTGRAVWDPKIGSGPIRLAMFPTDQPLSHAAMQLLKLWAALPKDDRFHIPVKTLVQFKGFVRSGAFQTKASPGEGAKTKQEKAARDNPSNHGSTLYDAKGELIAIEGTILRGCLASDQVRQPSLITSENFTRQVDYEPWWNLIINGVYVADSTQAVIYANGWLKTYAPEKRFDTHGLRFRRVSCEEKHNSDMSKLFGKKITYPTPREYCGGYDSRSESEDENGVVKQKKKKRKTTTPKKSPANASKSKPKVSKPVAPSASGYKSSDDDTDTEKTPAPLKAKRKPLLESFGSDNGDGEQSEQEQESKDQNPNALTPTEPVPNNADIDEDMSDDERQLAADKKLLEDRAIAIAEKKAAKRRRAEEEAKRQADEEAKRRADEEAKRQADEEKRRQEEDEARKLREQEEREQEEREQEEREQEEREQEEREQEERKRVQEEAQRREEDERSRKDLEEARVQRVRREEQREGDQMQPKGKETNAVSQPQSKRLHFNEDIGTAVFSVVDQGLTSTTHAWLWPKGFMPPISPEGWARCSVAYSVGAADVGFSGISKGARTANLSVAEIDRVISHVQDIYNEVFNNLVGLKREREELEKNVEDNQPLKKVRVEEASNEQA